MIPRIPDGGFTYRGEPVVPSSPISLIKRSSFLSGDIPVLCGPGQLSNAYPTDWSRSGTLLKIPKVIRIVSTYSSSGSSDITNDTADLLRTEYASRPEVFVDCPPIGTSLRINSIVMPIFQASAPYTDDNVFSPHLFNVSVFSATESYYPPTYNHTKRSRLHINVGFDPDFSDNWAEWSDFPPYITDDEIVGSFFGYDYVYDGEGNAVGYHDQFEANIYQPAASPIPPMVIPDSYIERIHWAYSLAPSFKALCFLYVPDDLSAINNIDDWVSVINGLSDYGYEYGGDVTHSATDADLLIPKINEFFGFT